MTEVIALLNNTSSSVQFEEISREVENTELAAGASTTVELFVELEEEVELGAGELVRVEDLFSPAFADVESVELIPGGGSSGPGPDNKEFLTIWNEGAEIYRLIYEVTIPSDVQEGNTFDISGTLEIGDHTETLPSATVAVDTDVSGVALHPTDIGVEPGEQVSFDLVATGADEGVGSYSLTVSTSDPNVGSIAAVELAGAVDDTSDVAEDGSSVLVEGKMDVAHDGAKEIVLAELTVDTDDEVEGESQFAIGEDATISDQTETTYDLDLIEDAMLTVSGKPTLDDYTNEDGIVDTDGLRDAIDNWRDGDIETSLLRDAIDAWRSGELVE